MRWVSSALVVVGAATTACTLSPGEPWAQIVGATAEASLASPPERFDESGRLLTAKSYGVALESIVATLTTLALDQAEGEALAFDPANPPAGFSLCHNGHCHADDGRLVDYEQVAAEAGASTSGFSLAFDVGTQTALREEPTSLPVDCEEPCVLERGDVVRARLFVDEVHVRGLVFDLLDQGRVPAGGRAVEFSITPRAPVSAPASARIERFEPVDWTVAASFALTPSLLDPIDFEDGVEARALEEAGVEVTAASTLTVSLTPTEDTQ